MSPTRLLPLLLALMLLLHVNTAAAREYLIDTSGAHASVNFKFDHLGIGRITGSFREFSGTFFYDREAPATAWIKVKIKTASLDSNQSTRDMNIRSSLFLDVEQYPLATFESDAISEEAGLLLITGDLTLHGVTRRISLQGRELGQLTDQWGRERVGFEASTTLNTLDFDMRFPPGNQIMLELYIEGVARP